MEQLRVNKSHNASWCEFFKKRDHAKSTSLKLFFSVPGFQSNKWNLRGSLSKNRPLDFAWKIILPGTLASERLFQDYNENRFTLIHNNFLAALGGAEYLHVLKPENLAVFAAL